MKWQNVLNIEKVLKLVLLLYTEKRTLLVWIFEHKIIMLVVNNIQRCVFITKYHQFQTSIINL